MTNARKNYDLRFEQALLLNMSCGEAAIAVSEIYLAGKPVWRGKRSTTAAERNAEFWHSTFLQALPAEIYQSDVLVLALAQYFGQERVRNFELIRRIAEIAPQAIRRAVRHSGTVLCKDSRGWEEVGQLAMAYPSEFAEIVQIGHIFRQAHTEHVAAIEGLHALLIELSPLELLVYTSLYAFEHLVPGAYLQDAPQADTSRHTQLVWEAMNDILAWKLTGCGDHAFDLTEAAIGKSLASHLSPFLFPSPRTSPLREDIYAVFTELVAAQIELNEFQSRSVDAFCYDDSICFQFVGCTLEIVERHPIAASAWAMNGEKLNRLHHYWFYRALDAFAASSMADQQIGHAAHHDSNRIAWIKAMRTKLRLTEVYGMDETVRTETGVQVDVWQLLLSSEMMTAFFEHDFVRPYIAYLNQNDDWRTALARLAMDGLVQSASQIRFPLTWADRNAKVASILPWTACEEFPQGHARSADAILAFWTNDLRALSTRLRNGQSGLTPDLHERPILKMGRYLFQLPWLVAMQNNSSAAINNLRRIGARRADAGEETRRIEQRLAQQFEARGFAVCLNYQPAKQAEDDPGEVDLMCVRDGHLLLLEIKSTYLRTSFKESWLHKTSALRKAGLQLRRKVSAVCAALGTDAALVASLGFSQASPVPKVTAWIVDTSIEHDHEYFSGFLKVSLEEVLIALRDDKDLLHDPDGIFRSSPVAFSACRSDDVTTSTTLYPRGFSADRFIDVIARAEVWQCSASGSSSKNTGDSEIGTM